MGSELGTPHRGGAARSQLSPLARDARVRTAALARAVAVALVAGAALNPLPVSAGATAHDAGAIEVAFAPGDAIDAKIIAAIDAAQREVLMLAYTFTHPRIARALSLAGRRGVRVELVADRGQTLELPASAVPALARAGTPVWLDGNFAAAHNKVVVIDADGPHATTITGSFNFTLAAQHRNAENIVIVRDSAEIARAYRTYFRSLQSAAERWAGR